jgi:hypothetical protein
VRTKSAGIGGLRIEQKGKAACAGAYLADAAAVDRALVAAGNAMGKPLTRGSAAGATPSWFDKLTMSAAETSEKDLMVSSSNHEVRAVTPGQTPMSLPAAT